MTQQNKILRTAVKSIKQRNGGILMNTHNFNTGAYASTSELAKHNNNMLWPYCHGKYTATAVARLSEWLAQDGVKLTDEMAACIMHYFITTYDMQGPAYVVLITLLRDNNIEAVKCFYRLFTYPTSDYAALEKKIEALAICPSGVINAVCSDSMRLGVFTDRLFTTTFEDDIVHLIEDDITVRELAAMTDPEPFIIACWKEAGLATVLLAKALYPCEDIKMSMDEFLSHCTPCGGNWGGLLLSGINELFPEVYEVIPEDMGINAFSALCELLRLLGIDTNEKA